MKAFPSSLFGLSTFAPGPTPPVFCKELRRGRDRIGPGVGLLHSEGVTLFTTKDLLDPM